jgi:hypothetical protein
MTVETGDIDPGRKHCYLIGLAEILLIETLESMSAGLWQQVVDLLGVHDRDWNRREYGAAQSLLRVFQPPVIYTDEWRNAPPPDAPTPR